MQGHLNSMLALKLYLQEDQPCGLMSWTVKRIPDYYEDN